MVRSAVTIYLDQTPHLLQMQQRDYEWQLLLLQSWKSDKAIENITIVIDFSLKKWPNWKTWLLTTTLVTLFPFSLPSEKEGRRKGEWISKIRDQKSYLQPGPKKYFVFRSAPIFFSPTVEKFNYLRLLHDVTNVCSSETV